MPTGPKGQKRPADVIGNAVRVMQIATGEAEEEYTDDGKAPASPPTPPEDWRALRLREVLAQRAERLADRAETTFRFRQFSL